jgi:hypothetical protein
MTLRHGRKLAIAFALAIPLALVAAVTARVTVNRLRSMAAEALSREVGAPRAGVAGMPGRGQGGVERGYGS